MAIAGVMASVNEIIIENGGNIWRKMAKAKEMARVKAQQ
jgi:hypothetical protein